MTPQTYTNALTHPQARLAYQTYDTLRSIASNAYNSYLNRKREEELTRRNNSLDNSILEIKNIKTPAHGVARHHYAMRKQIYSPELYQTIANDIQNQQGSAVAKFTPNAYHKRPKYKLEVNSDENYDRSYYSTLNNEINIARQNAKDATVLAHEYGHAIDPMVLAALDSYRKLHDSLPINKNNPHAYYKYKHDILHRELRASENGRRMLRDGYGQPDTYAKNTYGGVPTYAAGYYSQALNDLQYTNRNYNNITSLVGGRSSKRGFWQQAYGAYGNTIPQTWPKWDHSPEANSEMYLLADKWGKTPESVARKFTEGLTSVDPIKRRLLMDEALRAAQDVDMKNGFINDETTYAAFMPKIPAATPSGIPGTNVKWQPVRDPSVYNDNPIQWLKDNATQH